DGASHPLPLLLGVTRPDNHLVGRLVVTGTSTLGRLAPWRHWVTTTGSLAFTTAVGVIDRVLCDTTRERATAHPAGAACLGEVLVGVVRVGHRPHCRHAIRPDVALLTGTETHDHHAAVTTDQL